VVPEDVLIQRFTGRFICANCGASYHSELHRPNIEGQCDYCDNKNFIVRKDDNIDAIKTRLDIYHHNTKPLIEYYKGKSVLVEVDGNRDISVIFEEIKNILKG
jgi:adenylate kinase